MPTTDSTNSDYELPATELAASLTVRDIHESAAWYRGALGFQIDRTHERNGVVMAISLRAGHVRLLVTQDDGARGAEREKGAGFSLQITTTADVDAIAARAVAHGATLDTPPTTMPWGVRAFRLRDPDGFRLTLTAG